LEVRTIYFPASIEAERAARLEASSDPDTLAIAARVHLECSRPREAAAMLHRALDHLVLAAPKPPGPGSIPGWLPRAILGLEAKGEIAAAQALHDRLWSWLQETGDAARLRSWGADGAWTMTHELGLLSSAFPPDLRRSAAQVVLRRKPAADALAEAREFAKRQPKQAEQAAEMLYDLPGLYRLYFRPLQGIAAEPARARSGFLDLAHERFLPGLLLLLFAVLPSLLSLTSDPPAPAMQHAFRQGTLSHDTHEAWRALEGDCDGAPSPLPRAACDAARDAVRKAGEGDCAGARTALTTLDQNLGSVETSELAKPRAFESWLIPALDSACR
jgi:hypothetical protein